MAAPTLIESNGSTFSFGGSTGQSVTFSATPSNDEIIVLVYNANGISTSATGFTWPSGFTEFLASTTTNSIQLAAAWKRASSEGSATYSPTWTAGSGGNERTLGFRYSGCITSGSPIDASTTETFSFPGTSFSVTGITASVAETLHNIHLSSSGNLNSPTATGYAETVYNQSFGGSSFAMDSRAHFDNDIASSGGTGNITISAGGSLANITAFSFLLLPVASGGSTVPLNVLNLHTPYASGYTGRL